jgi:prepilin-type N-terminal cleavage/methylation domain-containing protein
MADSFQTDPHQSGLTVAELLVVMVVIAILAGFALMQRGSADEQFKRQNAAQGLKSALERARSDSVKRRADTSAVQAKVVVGTSSITLATDKNQDGVVNSADEQVTDLSGLNVVIAGDAGVSLPVTVSYNQRGEATAVDLVGDVAPIFWICNISCSSPTVENSNIVLVTPTGTVNLLPGGAEIPTFSPPSGITSVPPGNSINNYAAVTPSPTP